jgi:transcriptional regulator
MYSMPYYKEKDQQVLLNFMKQHPFAMLIGSANNIPAATQIPMLIEERDGKIFLRGHFMRQTDHHKAFEENPNALCVFTGAHTYVSASLYTNPLSASTWNYMSIHAKGKLHFLDTDELLTILEKTTALFENNEDSPASFKHLRKEYVEKLAKAIVGFEIPVEEMDTVFKLSQNKDESNYHRIIQHLDKGDTAAQKIAAEMKSRKEKLFHEK